MRSEVPHPPTLSLCMIVKNEEKDLPRCLVSVQGVVDEIILVDTGSSDRTLEIAAEFGAKIFHHTWQDNFAIARNVSLEHATGDWILFMDADEEMPPETRSQIKTVLSATDADGLIIRVLSFIPSGWMSEHFETLDNRIFRNRPVYRFEGVIHEQAIGSIQRSGGRMEESDLRLWHYGYLQQVVQGGMDRLSRNIKFLEQALARDPKNAFLCAKLGLSYYGSGDYSLASTYLRRLMLELDCQSLDHGLVHHALINYAVIEKLNQNFLVAAQIAEASLRINSQPALTLLSLKLVAHIYLLMAVDHFKSALQSAPADGEDVAFSEEKWDHFQQGRGDLQQAYDYYVRLRQQPQLKNAVVAEVEAVIKRCREMLDSAAPFTSLSAFSRTSATMALLLNSSDVRAALQTHAGQINPDLLALVYTYAHTARADGDIPLMERLEALAENISAISSVTSGVRDCHLIHREQNTMPVDLNPPTISLCMIVKNEERDLHRCLRSVRGVVDEIILVDTGSTDRTVEIAAEYGANIFHHAWQDDFALARNISLEQATSEWILFLDADEELEPETRIRINNVLNATDADGLLVCCRSFQPPGALVPYYDSPQARVFRNRTEFRFEGLIHEQIIPSIQRYGGKRIQSDLCVLHYGQTRSTVQGGENRLQRNLNLLERAYVQSPEDVYLCAKLGFTYYDLGNYESANTLLHRAAFELDRSALVVDSRQHLWFILAAIAYIQQDFPLALRYAQTSMEFDSPNALTLFSMKLLAQVHMSLGVQHLQTAFQPSPDTAKYDAKFARAKFCWDHLQRGRLALQNANDYLTRLVRHPKLDSDASAEVETELRRCHQAISLSSVALTSFHAFLQATETLEMLLTADNPLVFLETHPDKLNPDLLTLVRSKADAARFDGDVAAGGLDHLAAMIEKAPFYQPI